MKLIVGLGNPGKEFEGTRHNVGAEFVDFFAKKHGFVFRKNRRLKSFIGKSKKHKSVILCKPMTFMNNSGVAVKLVKNRLKINARDIVVVCDDIVWPLNSCYMDINSSTFIPRIKHRGVISVATEIKDQNFERLAIGIQPLRKIRSREKFVLEKFSDEERVRVNRTFELAVPYVDNYIKTAKTFMFDNTTRTDDNGGTTNV